MVRLASLTRSELHEDEERCHMATAALRSLVPTNRQTNPNRREVKMSHRLRMVIYAGISTGGNGLLKVMSKSGKDVIYAGTGVDGDGH